jgi:ABC-type Fe3+/spermidine/putrescine transport system ATPase subunit
VTHSTSAAALLELKELRRAFGRAPSKVQAVDRVSISIAPGEIVSILGPSGCGKTTTMRIIAGLERADSGDVLLRGRSVLNDPPHKRNMGLVFQSLAVFPHMTVFENVGFGLRMRGISKSERELKIESVLDLVQLNPHEFGGRMPNELSGGQLQRVALARTLVTEPDVVLLDEPMAALDRRLRDHMAVELKAIQKRLNIASFYVTHDQETASVMSDRIVIMNSGRVIQVGTPVEVYQRPANRFVANFLGDVNCLAGTIVSTAGNVATVRFGDCVLGNIECGLSRSETATVMMRPEHIEISPVDGRCGFAEALVRQIDFVSGTHRYFVEIADGTKLSIRGRVDDPVFNIGSRVSLSIDSSHVRVLQN